MESNQTPATTNYEKFQTGNPVVRKLIEGFFAKIEKAVHQVPKESMLDAGCGEGQTLAMLQGALPAKVTGFDINPECVAFAQKRFPEHTFQVESIYELPWEDKTFDLVICCEVLEHLDTPDKALAELLRVARRGLVLSVPFEPWFQIGSFCRGKYWKDWGNHPEHVNHWNPKTFETFLKAQAPTPSITVAFPWLIGTVQLDD